MALSNSKTEFKEWEQGVDAEYKKKEYSGVYEGVLHLRNTLAYMESKEGKKLIIEEFDELRYETQLDLTKKSLKTREAELKFLKGLFK